MVGFSRLTALIVQEMTLTHMFTRHANDHGDGIVKVHRIS